MRLQSMLLTQLQLGNGSLRLPLGVLLLPEGLLFFPGLKLVGRGIRCRGRGRGWGGFREQGALQRAPQFGQLFGRNGRGGDGFWLVVCRRRGQGGRAAVRAPSQPDDEEDDGGQQQGGPQDPPEGCAQRKVAPIRRAGIPEALAERQQREQHHHADSDESRAESTPDELLGVDTAFRIRQQQPGGRIQQQRGAAKHGNDHDDAADDDRIDAETEADAGSDASDPAGLALDAEFAHPAEEAVGAADCQWGRV